jgi:hypothetical protein
MGTVETDTSVPTALVVPRICGLSGNEVSQGWSNGFKRAIDAQDKIPCSFPVNSLVEFESPLFMRVSRSRIFLAGKIPCWFPSSREVAASKLVASAPTVSRLPSVPPVRPRAPVRWIARESSSWTSLRLPAGMSPEWAVSAMSEERILNLVDRCL